MSRRDRHGSDDYDGQVGHFSQKIFRLKICFLLQLWQKWQLSWHAFAKSHALLSLLPTRFVQMTKQTQLVFWPKQTKSLLGSHLVPVNTHWHKHDHPVHWRQLRPSSAAAVGEKRFKAENAHGNPRAGKEENHDAFRSTKSFSSRGEGITTFRNLRELIQL